MAFIGSSLHSMFVGAFFSLALDRQKLVFTKLRIRLKLFLVFAVAVASEWRAKKRTQYIHVTCWQQSGRHFFPLFAVAFLFLIRWIIEAQCGPITANVKSQFMCLFIYLHSEVNCYLSSFVSFFLLSLTDKMFLCVWKRLTSKAL